MTTIPQGARARRAMLTTTADDAAPTPRSPGASPRPRAPSRCWRAFRRSVSRRARPSSGPRPARLWGRAVGAAPPCGRRPPCHARGAWRCGPAGETPHLPARRRALAAWTRRGARTPGAFWVQSRPRCGLCSSPMGCAAAGVGPLPLAGAGTRRSRDSNLPCIGPGPVAAADASSPPAARFSAVSPLAAGCSDGRSLRTPSNDWART